MTINQNLFTFNNLSSYPSLFHAVSTVYSGSMKDNNQINFKNIQKFLEAANIKTKNIVLSEQVHGNTITFVTNVRQRVLPMTDGLLTTKKHYFLGILTADCVPLLFYDKNKNIIGAVHAGYKGLSKQIIKYIINEFQKLGSNMKDIIVGIGPSIGVCCYDVKRERIEMFQRIFPGEINIYKKRGEKYFLNLQKIALGNLLEQEIPEENIEIADICTNDNFNFFSYRREGQEKSGRFISIIGLV